MCHTSLFIMLSMSLQFKCFGRIQNTNQRLIIPLSILLTLHISLLCNFFLFLKKIKHSHKNLYHWPQIYFLRLRLWKLQLSMSIWAHLWSYLPASVLFQFFFFFPFFGICCFFLPLIFFFLFKDNCFTELCDFMSYINKNQQEFFWRNVFF